ncbi:MAG: ankyrin repeat domain-containing protein [Armatimonadota bacterium]
MIEITCPQCHIGGTIDDSFVGRRIRCNNCGTAFTVPSTQRIDSPVIAVTPGTKADAPSSSMENIASTLYTIEAVIDEVKEGNLVVIQQALRSGFSIHSANERGNTLLHAAANLGQIEIAHYLLANGADVNTQNHEGVTALLWASRKGYLDICKLLLSYQSDVNIATDTLWFPLHEAAAEGHRDIVCLLLDNSASIQASTEEGQTPLHLASLGGHLDVVQLLVERGADVNASNGLGISPIQLAGLAENATALISYLQTHGASIPAQRSTADESIVQQNGQSPLQVPSADDATPSSLLDALRDGRFNDVTRVLQEQPALVNMADGTGLTLLMGACSAAPEEVIQTFIRLGADANARTQDGHTALHAAALHCQRTTVVNILLANGADIDALAGEYKNTPLHYAVIPLTENPNPNVIAQHALMVAFLLDAGANPYIEDTEGNTPLVVAIEDGHLQIIEEFLARNVCVDLQHNQRRLPLHEAVIGGNIEIVRRLLDYGADVNEEVEVDTITFTALHAAPDDEGIVNLLLARGAKISNSRWKVQPIQFAVLHGHLTKMHCLLQHLGGVNAQIDKSGWTCTHYAAMEGNVQVIADLLQHGADPNAMNAGGLTPYDLACKAGHQQAQSLFEQYGASPFETRITTIGSRFDQLREQIYGCPSLILQSAILDELDAALACFRVAAREIGEEAHENLVDLLLAASLALIQAAKRVRETSPDPAALVQTCEQARRYINESLSLQETAKGHLFIGLLYSSLYNQIPEAIAEYQRAATLDPYGEDGQFAARKAADLANNIGLTTRGPGQAIPAIRAMPRRQNKTIFKWIIAGIAGMVVIWIVIFINISRMVSAVHPTARTPQGIPSQAYTQTPASPTNVPQTNLPPGDKHPVSDLAPESVNSSSETYVTDITWASAVVGYDAPNYGAYQDRDHDYDHSIWAHARSDYAYQLGRKWRTLSGYYGLDRPSDNKGSVVFVINGDGRELLRSETIKGSVARPFQVDVSGVQELHLIVEDGGDGITSDHGIWFTPRLSLSGSPGRARIGNTGSPARSASTRDAVITVNASSERWNDSRIMVNPGNTLIITAKGRARYGEAPLTTPDGKRHDENTLVAEKYDANAVMPGAPIGALIGATRDQNGNLNEKFVIGESISYQVRSSGQLVLLYNDSDWSDNEGKYTAWIIVY